MDSAQKQSTEANCSFRRNPCGSKKLHGDYLCSVLSSVSAPRLSDTEFVSANASIGIIQTIMLKARNRETALLTNYEGKLTVWFLIYQEVAKMDEAKMVLSYNKLWKMLIDRKLKKKDLQKMTHLSSSVIAKMGRDESVHLDTIVKICIALQCNISDIVELQRKEA